MLNKKELKMKLFAKLRTKKILGIRNKKMIKFGDQMMKIMSANILLVNILYTTLHPNRQDYLNKKIQEDIKDLNQNIEVKNMIVDIKKVKIFVTVPLKNLDAVFFQTFIKTIY